MRKWLVVSILLGVLTCACNRVSNDPNLQLSFSHDTVLFDTVFSTIGSSTKRVMVYNPNKHAVEIERVVMREGEYFRVNLDGENQLDNLKNIVVRGNDSLYLFIRAMIDPQSEDSPVFIEDEIVFGLNGKTQRITLQAYGQNVEKIQGKQGLKVYQNLRLTNTKPYLIYDTVAVAGNLTIEAGTTIYMHQGAMLYAYGNITAEGEKDAPIIFRGDRTDMLFDSVPYRMASGQWDGLYLIHTKENPPPVYSLNYVDILSGSIGCMPTLKPKMHYHN